MHSIRITHTERQLLPAGSPLSSFYRAGSGLLGMGLLLFGVLGLVNKLRFFSTDGDRILGLSSNGLLSVISIVVGTVLIGAAAEGGVLASTVTATIGGLFVLSGLANLAVLNTGFNVLAFRVENVIFSLVVGMGLLVVGLYGRVSGGLAPDNPFRMARAHRHGLVDPTEQQLLAERERISALTEIASAEQAVGEGRASAEQEELVERDHRMLLAAERKRAWRHARSTPRT